MSPKIKRKPAKAAAQRPSHKTRRSAGRPARGELEKRYDELLEGALDLFLEKGFDQTSIDAISASVGMAKRTVYARYPNKKAIFKEAMERAIDQSIVPVDAFRALETEDFKETLFVVARVLVTNMTGPAGIRLMRLMNAEAFRMPEILSAYTLERRIETTVTYLADFFRRHTASGNLAVKKPEFAARAFLNLVVSRTTRAAAWGKVLDKAAIEDYTRNSVELFLDGICPR